MIAAVYHVAILRLATEAEAEARSLAAELGGVAYDHRLKLAAGMPAVVMTTPDAEAARACAARLRGRGHEVFAFSGVNVVPVGEMLALRRFACEDDALVSLDGTGDRLAWADVHALVRATQRTTTETTQVVTEKKFSAARAAMTGGLLMNKKTTTSRTSHATENEAVLYIFGPPGTTPWLLREQHARYDALGAAVTLHSLENFQLVVAMLRERAPQALFDERLVTRKQGSAAEVDMLAHIIARAPR